MTPAIGDVTSPWVMLSPKARNFVAVSCGMRLTVTGKLHVAVRLRESLAVHETEVVPSANVVPDAGVHDTVTGDCPPLADGVVKVTAVPLADVVLAVIAAGHVRLGGSGMGVGVGVGVGVDVGEVGLPHPVAMAEMSAAAPTSCRTQRAPLRRLDFTYLIDRRLYPR
ncbi:MAG: hypothetical protein Q8L75_05995 [Acidobacteriota bacterium]|nr:hypothetical protein [Acidobacteriota bacterium]